MAWTQVYDPLHNWILSTLVAALPILVLFGLLAGLRVKPHWCAIAGAGTAVLVAVLVFGMPLRLAGMSFVYGVGFGVLKIAWIVPASRNGIPKTRTATRTAVPAPAIAHQCGFTLSPASNPNNTRIGSAATRVERIQLCNGS